MGICTRHHKQCAAFSEQVETPKFLPKMLLDLTNISFNPNGSYLKGEPVLISSVTERCPDSSHAALSHCWGKLQPIRALKSNISEWRNGIPWSKFPRTFREASFVAKSLGIHYLWIDSLCIIQDSEEDWIEQSALMGKIYRCSVICISAWDFPDRGPVFLFPLLDGHLTHPKGALRTRAWALQEELLSTRRIIFGEDMVYWHCISCKTSEAIPMSIFDTHPSEAINRIDWTRVYQLDIGGVLDLSSSRSKDVEMFYMCWLLIAQAYSKKQLTKDSDKLAALAGITTEFQKATGDTYNAGLWRKYFWRQLLWHVSSHNAPCFNRRQPKEIRESEPTRNFKGDYPILIRWFQRVSKI